MYQPTARAQPIAITASNWVAMFSFLGLKYFDRCHLMDNMDLIPARFPEPARGIRASGFNRSTPILA
jgi:hypothetical protein